MSSYEPSIEDVLALDWRSQPKGRKAELEARLKVVAQYIKAESRWLEEAGANLTTMSLRGDSTIPLREYHEARLTYRQALKAEKILNNELSRRGGERVGEA